MITRLVVAHPVVERIHELLGWKMRMHNSAISAASLRLSLADTREREAQAALEALKGAGEAAERARKAQEAKDAEIAAWKKRKAERRLQEQERVARRTAEEERKFRLRFGRNLDGTPAGEKHAPRSAHEAWVVDSILSLTGEDTDRATIKNGVGFNKSDSYYGHQMAAGLTRGEGLTDEQYDHAAKMLAKYHGQIGRSPSREEVK